MPELAAEPGTLFPNAPLKEAALEVRFNPLLKIERDIARFQERITEGYPLSWQGIDSIGRRASCDVSFSYGR